MKIDSNMKITNIAISGTGDVSKLEINGSNVPLASSVDIVDEYTDTLSLSSLTEGDTVTIPIEGHDGAKSVVITITE